MYSDGLPEVMAPDGEAFGQERLTAAFRAAAAVLRTTRLRNLAVHWNLFADAEDADRYVESWAEHLRQHDRVTGEDRAAEASVRAFHAGDDPPRVTHLITPREL